MMNCVFYNYKIENRVQITNTRLVTLNCMYEYVFLFFVNFYGE